MSGQRKHLRAIEIAALLIEMGAVLPAHGHLLLDLLSEPDNTESWRCVRCGRELVLGERYACLSCVARDDADEPWPGQRPTGNGGRDDDPDIQARPAPRRARHA